MNYLLQSKIKECKKCNNPKPILPSEEIKGDMVMICYTNPQFNTEEFLSRLKEIHWPIEKTYITSLLKCESGNLKYCYDWFKQELFIINPIAIVALGSDAYGYLIQESNPEMLIQGSLLDVVSRDNWKQEFRDIGVLIREHIAEEKKKFEKWGKYCE